MESDDKRDFTFDVSCVSLFVALVCECGVVYSVVP